MLQLCMWRSSKVIGNDNVRYNAHEFVLVFHCNDDHIAVSSPSGRKRLLGTYWAPKSCMVETILVLFFCWAIYSWKQKSYITNRQRQNAASLTPIPQTQWLLSPKYRVKIELTPFLKLPLPYIPQLASKIYLCKTQMSKCTMRIDVTTTRIVSNKFILHGLQRKQWSKWNIGAHSTKSLQ